MKYSICFLLILLFGIHFLFAQTKLEKEDRSDSQRLRAQNFCEEQWSKAEKGELILNSFINQCVEGFRIQYEENGLQSSTGAKKQKKDLNKILEGARKFCTERFQSELPPKDFRGDFMNYCINWFIEGPEGYNSEDKDANNEKQKSLDKI